MATEDKAATHNLKAVIRETGLKPDTLRAWERRYGLPQPKRTPGHHRLYSQRDIDTLKWLVARKEEGLSISRAVALWRQLEETVGDPLQEPVYALADSALLPSAFQTGSALAELREAWLRACLDYNEAKAEQVLTYALALYPSETVCFEILQKCLGKIGDGWYRGETTVQQEHFASELAMRRLEALMAASPAPTRGGRVLVGCAPDDEHSFPALLTAFLLKQRGWEVRYLGARVPSGRMEETLADVRPHIVILTAQHLSGAATLLDTAMVLKKQQVVLAFGGRIFNLLPALQRRIPGHFLGVHIETAPRTVEKLLTTSSPLPQFDAVSEEYSNALKQFCRRQSSIHGDMWQQMEETDFTPNHFLVASDALGKNITAALTLGDMNYLCTDIEWVVGLLENHQIPTRLLNQFLKAYFRAARIHLGELGSPVVGWLAQLSRGKDDAQE